MYLVLVHNIIVVSLNALRPSGYFSILVIRLCKIASASEEKLGLENCIRSTYSTYQLHKLARDVNMFIPTNLPINTQLSLII